MASVIDELLSGRGAAATWLNSIRGDDGFANISCPDWEGSLAVISDVDLFRVRMAECVVRPNFVNCSISHSEFVDLRTDGHFWGGGNEWRNCLFRASILKSIISPQCLFSHCVFSEVTFDDYAACETLFESCAFANCQFRSLRTNPMRRSAWAIARMASNGSSLQFVACKFTHTDFLHCSFADCAFVKSEFDNTAAKASDFTNIRSDLKWWSDSEQCEVFVTFLNEAVGQFAAELGDNSTAVAALSKYRTDYVSGVITSKDYSVCLYNGEVPDKELDVVDRILDRLESQFPL